MFACISEVSSTSELLRNMFVMCVSVCLSMRYWSVHCCVHLGTADFKHTMLGSPTLTVFCSSSV